MRTYLKLTITAFVASAVLAGLVGSASAGRLSSSSQTLRTTWSSLELVGFGATVRCAVTLEGSLHSVNITKTPRTLIGSITLATVRRPCTGGTAWASNGIEVNEILGGIFPQTLPWHLTYEGFEGTLPEITRLRTLLTGATFTIRATFLGITVLCSYTTGANGNATGTATRNLTDGSINNLRASGRIRSTTGGCPEGSFTSRAEDGLITVVGAATRISVRLI
jgi:hypothetical protein